MARPNIADASMFYYFLIIQDHVQIYAIFSSKDLLYQILCLLELN